MVVVKFSTDSVCGVSIENDVFSNVSVFRSLNFEQHVQKFPFSFILNGNARLKRRHSTRFSNEMETGPYCHNIETIQNALLKIAGGILLEKFALFFMMKQRF